MIVGDQSPYDVDEGTRLVYHVIVGLAHGIGWPDVLNVPEAHLELLAAYDATTHP